MLAKQKKHKKQKLRGGAVRFDEGPFDEFNHILERKTAVAHQEELKEKRARLENELQQLQQDYDREATHLQAGKSEFLAVKKEEREHALQRELKQMDIDASEAQRANAGAASFWNWWGVMTHYIWEGIPRIWSGTGETLIGIGNIADRTVNGKLFTTFWLFILSILLFIIIIVLIVLVLGGVIKSGSGEPSESEKAEQEKKNGKCSRVVPLPTDLSSVTDFGTSLQENLNDAIKKSLKFFQDIPPQFSKMTTLDYSNMVSNPFGGIYDVSAYLSDSIANNEFFRSLYFYGLYFYSAMMAYISKIVGSAASDKFNQTIARETIMGRNDSVNNINSSIFPKPLMRTKGIDTSKNAVINISMPENIEWKMNDREYEGLDIDKVPPSLLKLPDKKNNNITIEDKKEIVIPWIIKDKYYVLSCENAYFKNNPNEKANILIDNYENNTCTYDLSSRVENYSVPKTRHRYTNDLSQFL
jgi:hypothetical protein